MSLLGKIRDIAYDIVKREGEFTLQFIADFFRPNQSKKHYTDKNPKNENFTKERLSRNEQKLFDKMLKRRENEDQIEYWKRRKYLLSIKDKKRFIQQSMKRKQQQLTEKKRKTEAQSLLTKMHKGNKNQDEDNLSRKK